eukprot:3105469-Amphidinium_carterae.1
MLDEGRTNISHSHHQNVGDNCPTQSSPLQLIPNFKRCCTHTRFIVAGLFVVDHSSMNAFFPSSKEAGLRLRLHEPEAGALAQLLYETLKSKLRGFWHDIPHQSPLKDLLGARPDIACLRKLVCLASPRFSLGGNTCEIGQLGITPTLLKSKHKGTTKMGKFATSIGASVVCVL